MLYFWSAAKKRSFFWGGFCPHLFSSFFPFFSSLFLSFLRLFIFFLLFPLFPFLLFFFAFSFLFPNYCRFFILCFRLLSLLFLLSSFSFFLSFLAFSSLFPLFSLFCFSLPFFFFCLRFTPFDLWAAQEKPSGKRRETQPRNGLNIFLPEEVSADIFVLYPAQNREL